MRSARLTQFAWGLLVYNFIVVVWGAFVRASYSGDGCGNHWPFCDGKLVPDLVKIPQVIEYAHRLSSGLVVPMLIVLCIWAFRAYPSGHPARFGAIMTLPFIVIEAVLGAVLVKFGLVSHADSIQRAFVMSAHLINTFLLLASIALTAWWSDGGGAVQLRGQGRAATVLIIGLFAALVLGVSGGITALVDTLYPADSLMKALHQDIYPGVHYLIRLRLLHPFIAVGVGIYTVLMAKYVVHMRPSIDDRAYDTRRFARLVTIMFVVEIAAGFLNLLMLAPVWMQLVHLLLADLLWVFLVLLAASALTKRYDTRENL